MPHQDPDSLIPGRKTGRPRKHPKPKPGGSTARAVEAIKAELNEEPPKRQGHLDPWDMLALERLELEELKARREHDQATIALHLAQGREARAVTGIQNAATEYKRFADDLAKRYGFRWDATSYNPETGELVGT